MNKIKFCLGLLFFCFSSLTFAQKSNTHAAKMAANGIAPKAENQHRCGSDERHAQMLEDPVFAKNYNDKRALISQEMLNKSQPACATPLVVPVVVHFQSTTIPNQCMIDVTIEQIDQMNLDFAGCNANAGEFCTWIDAGCDAFGGTAGEDAQPVDGSCIKFCLADQNLPTDANLIPGGLAITTSYNANNQNAPNQWNGYLNIYVGNLGGGILGFVNFLGGGGNTNTTQGASVTTSSFGSQTYAGCNGVGTGAPFDGGATLTHEVGHWFGLSHTFSDNVADTPPQSQSNNGSVTVNTTNCTSSVGNDYSGNFMDYVDDDYMFMFSEDQVVIMRNTAAPQADWATNSISCSNDYETCAQQGSCRPDHCSDGTQNMDETDVDCGGAACLACPTCSDGILNGSETAIDCGGTDCAACPPCTGVTFNLLTDDYPAETTWSIVDANGNQVATGGGYAAQGATVTENVCLFTGCYDFIINDSYGDGICCGFGNGSYDLVDDISGSVLASGGQFGISETTNFCVTADPATCAGVDLDINFDGFPTQTGWEITNDATGGVEASGGSYGNALAESNLGLPNVACLADGCYTLTFNDALNNGMCPFRATASSQGTFISPGTLIAPGTLVATLGTVVTPGLCGNFTLTDVNGATLASGGGAFGSSDSQQFCLTNGAASLWDGEDYDEARLQNSNKLNVFPTLAQNNLSVYYSLETVNPVQVSIVDINGQIMQQYLQDANATSELQLNVSDLSAGVYFVQMVANDTVLVEKFVKQ